MPETDNAESREQGQWQLAKSDSERVFIYTLHRSERGFEGENEVQLQQDNGQWLLSFVYRNAPRFDHFTNVELLVDGSWIPLEGAERPDPRLTRLHIPSPDAEVDYRRLPQNPYYEYLIRHSDGKGGIASYRLSDTQVANLNHAERIRFRYWSEQRQRNYSFDLAGFESALTALNDPNRDCSDIQNHENLQTLLQQVDEQVIALLIDDILMRQHPGAHVGLRSWGSAADRLAAEKLFPAMISPNDDIDETVSRDEAIERWRTLVHIAGPRTVDAVFAAYNEQIERGDEQIIRRYDRVITLLGPRALSNLLALLSEGHSADHCRHAIRLIGNISENDRSTAVRSVPALLRILDERKQNIGLRLQAAETIKSIAKAGELPNADLFESELSRIESELDSDTTAAAELRQLIQKARQSIAKPRG
ncbi:MAG: hypothetical protein JJU20_04580 [Opitutales bacterium]|nr:hypothetical protein [Opitutales bacterium]